MANETDIFLCYRRLGAQTAKLFYHYCIMHNYPYAVWYSDEQPYGNYKQDIANLVRQAECVILFISKDFTNGFLDENGRINQRRSEESPSKYECITVQEIIEIEKKRQSDQSFKVIGINLDLYTLNEKDALILEEVFSQAGIYTDQSVSFYLQMNTNYFNTATDYEERLFAKMMTRLLPIFNVKKEMQGNFWFGSKRTSLDLVYNGFNNPIRSDSIVFEISSESCPFYERISKKRKEFERDSQNDDMISVVNVNSEKADNTEELSVIIQYKTIKYELFRKTIELLSAGDEEVRGHLDYCVGESINNEAFQVPNAMGLAFMVITHDDHFLFTQRSIQRHIRPGEPDCSIVEGLKPVVKENGKILYDYSYDDYLGKEIRRGFEEEICDEWRSDNKISIYGIILDREYAQWNVFGVIKTSMTAEEIEIAHPKRKDTYEKNRITKVKFDPNEPSDLRNMLIDCEEKGMWDTALATVYGALIHMGIQRVDQFIKERLEP